MKNLIFVSMGLMFLMLTACSSQNLDKTGTNSINLEQDFQEVIHYDCNNNLTSDKVESVASPTKYVNINPTNWNNLGGSTFLDTATGSTAPVVSGYTSFWIDHGDGALSMHVITGINVINYTFYSCDQRAADGSCAVAKTVQEQGQVTMNINYVEKTIPTPLKVNDCVTPTPTPTPGSF